jgi:hypothetical protein
VTFGKWSRVKIVRHKTVLGLAIGERSLMAAEVVAGEDRPIVRRVAELEYPAGVSPADGAQFGELLAAFRKEQGFTARMTVIGLPAKWIVVKQKEVPPTDAATLADLLRTGAEAEFSSELKDMAYDYVISRESNTGKSVLLVGTPRKYIDAVDKACETSKLTPAGITSSALVLGEATGKSSNPGTLVLAVSPGGAELTARQNGSPSAIRYVRGPEQPAPFVSAVRRAVSTLPTGPGGREIVLWDQTGLDISALGQQLGMKVRGGELASLGVDVAIPSLNGTASRFATPVALALSFLEDSRPAVDFLHSRLAPPRNDRLPRWAYSAIALAVILLGLVIYGYACLGQQQSALDRDRRTADGMKASVEAAKAFVSRVSFASAWQAADPRYLTCLRGLTQAMADDDQTYATNVVLRESTRAGSVSVATPANGDKPPPTGELFGQITGKASDPNGWSKLQSRLHATPGFTDVKLLSTSNADRQNEVSFSITFNFQKPAATSH